MQFRNRALVREAWRSGRRRDDGDRIIPVPAEGALAALEFGVADLRVRACVEYPGPQLRLQLVSA
jgi:hypothetical protein